MSTEEKTYHGSCHCGAIKYTIKDVKLDSTTIGKCNCTFCKKANFQCSGIPLDKLEVTQPASIDEISGQYKFNTKECTHYFCKECSTNVFMTGFGQVYVNTPSIDDIDLSKIPIKRYANGRDNDWGNIKDTPHEGGPW